MNDFLYRAAIAAALPLVHAVAPFNERVRRGVDGRRASLASLQAWSAASRDRTRPLVWLHAPSVGEALMAQAILAVVRERAPDVQAIFTFFSPSAERMAERVGADWHGYLPWDAPGPVRAALDAVEPDAVAFVRTEIWPELVRQAKRRGAGVVLVNAVLGAGSSRTGRAARTLLGNAYAALDEVGAVSDDDASRFPRLGGPRAQIRVTGDARFDQVCARIDRLDRSQPLLRALAGRNGPCLVAGSTWPADEAALLGTNALAGWRSIIAPHEPTAAHVEALEARVRASGATCARLPAMDSGDVPDVDVLVVDRVGVLADLYAVADAAYVGGGFGTSGLHSVAEPAALGVPVVYGPRHGNAQEAARLADAGGGFIVEEPLSLADTLRALRDDVAARSDAGVAARVFVEAQRGGAAGGAEVILRHLRRH